MAEEQRPHIQASTSSERMICSTSIHLGNKSHEVLLDSGSTISSISTILAQSLNLPTTSAPLITVIFGDNNGTYHSQTQAICTFCIAQQTFTHALYILPKQLFPITLGCDWFVKTGAQLHFDSKTMILPRTPPIPLFRHQSSPPAIVNAQINSVPSSECL